MITTRPGTFASRLPVVTLLGANTISLTGNMLTAVAIPWFVLQMTGSAAQTGITGAVIVIPTIIAGIFGGAFVDRFGHKRASILADLASGITVAIIPLVHLLIGIEFWQLLVLMFLSALLDVPGASARQSMVPELAEAADFQIERINSAFSSGARGGQIAGPLLAGLLITSFGATNVLWINAGTFVLSAALVAVGIPSAIRQDDGSETNSGYLTEMREGFQFVRRDHLILTLLVIAAILNFVSNPLTAVVLPVYANQVYGTSTSLGFMLAGFGAGALAGAVLYGVVGYRLPRRTMFIGACLGSTIPFGILSMTPSFSITLVALILLGVLTGPLAPIFTTVLQERTPASIRGRIFGLTTAGVWIVLPLGMLVAGVLLESIGLRNTLLVEAFIFLFLALSLLAMPILREMEAPSPRS